VGASSASAYRICEGLRKRMTNEMLLVRVCEGLQIWLFQKTN
jgi:hypothetical protein